MIYPCSQSLHDCTHTNMDSYNGVYMHAWGELKIEWISLVSWSQCKYYQSVILQMFVHIRYLSINIKVEIHNWNATIWSSNGNIDNDNNCYHHCIHCRHHNLDQIKKAASCGPRASKSQND